MTSGALAAIRTLRELSLVGIGLVAVGALRERNRFFEITATVALDAADHGVFSHQWELGFRVIEFLAQTCSKFLPSAGVVAGLASLRKGAVVRIAMAIRALAERNAGVTRFVVRTGRVALLASDLHMQAGQ